MGERNFLSAFGSEDRAPEVTRGLGIDHGILRADIKKWSVGAPLRAALDSLEILSRASG